jgi:hypothetical protein
VVSAATDGKKYGWQRYIPARQTGRHNVAARRAHFVRLPQWNDTGGIWAGFDLWRRLIGAGGLEDEISSRAAQQAARIASTCPEPVVRTL